MSKQTEESGNRMVTGLVKRRWRPRNRIDAMVLMVLTAIGIYLCYRLALPFLPALAWALTLAVMFVPFQRWLETKLKRPGLAAAISVLMAGLIVALPVIFVGQRIIQETAKGVEIVKTKVESGEWRRAIDAEPRLASIANWIEQKVDLAGAVKDFTTWLTTTAGAILKGSVMQAIGFILTFYLLFYFLRDRQAALQSLRTLSPLTGVEMDGLIARIYDTIYATVYGTLAVAVVQGLLGGLMFWWLGLPTPLLWGVVMALLAVLPVFGAFLVWIPAAFFLALSGSWEKALILAVWGGVVVSGIDNLLQPMLIGERLKMHTILAFIAVVGGLLLFGSAGLILGPVALTITTVFLKNWRSQAEEALMAVTQAKPEPALAERKPA